ncbi:MAG TPA: hypothetical protein VNE16_04465 [Vicinamibacterales bacterium]|nr:hypothetical protein [Vicinamibacterales bacterium]
MASDRRRQALLGALLIVAVGVIVYQLNRRPAAAPTAASNGVRAEARPRAGAGAPVGPVPDVHLQALQRPQPQPAPAERNLFQFGEARPVPSPGMPAAPAGAAGGMRPGVGPTGPGGAPLAAGPPPIPLKFIGILAAPGRIGRVAILTDGRDVYHGREGDIIEGRFRILHIGVESIVMAYLDGSGRQTIRLTGGGV